MAFAAPRVIRRCGREDLTPIFWIWQRTKNGRSFLRELVSVGYPTLLRARKNVIKKSISIDATFSG
jgi:hypothetical protein